MSQSPWTHSICEDCWYKRNPDNEPVVLTEATLKLEQCCFCSLEHNSGIYMRHDPRTIDCNGVFGIHTPEDSPLKPWNRKDVS